MFNSTGFPAASTSSPFGTQSAFKPNTGFSGPVFGSNPGTSLFSGSTTQQSGGLFGSTTAPTFGQTQTTQPAFGSSTGLFGTQQNATPTTGIFGSTTGSAFGQSKPFGFGNQPQTTGLFGQQPQPTQPQQTSLFGQPAAQSTSGLFSSSTGFGGTTATGGTTIKFTPVTGTDTMVKNGNSTNISTRHHCITCMKEYEGKSLEELRLEDYAANRKGPQQGTQGSLGLFGSTGQTSLFGGTTSSGFGTGTTGVFGSGSTGNSLFGKPAATATAFGTPATTTSTFGFNTTTPSNPFGANAATKPFGTTTPQTSLFGQTTQASTGFGTQPTTGFGAFGAQQNTGGLFGVNKPTFNLGTNTSTAFPFNQPATTSTGSSLFGAKPATSTFGTFGTPATTSTGFGTSAFGTTNQNTSIFAPTFGKQPTGFNFGNTSTTNTLGSGLNLGGGSLFGNTANKPVFGQTNTSLFGSNTFGNTNSAFNTGSSSLGGLGGSSLFGNTGGISGQQGGLGGGQSPLSNPITQHMLAYASMPFGNSPLFQNLLPQQTGKADELIKPTSPAAQKALITGQNYKASPKNNSKIKVVPIEAQTKKSLFDGLDGEEEATSETLNQSVRHSPKRLVLRTRPLNELSLNQRNLQLTSNIISEMSPIIKTSPRFSLRIPQSPTSVEAQTETDGVSTSRPDPVLNHDKISLHIKKSLESAPLENTMAELCPNKENKNLQLSSNSLHSESMSKSDMVNDQPSTTSSSVDSELEDTVPGLVEDNGTPHPTRIILRRLGYYTIPKMDQLAELVDSEGRCIVENFTVGRLNYGNLFFPDSMDVAGLNLDEIVHFRHKEVVVYPDDNEKPPVGEGLNRKAQVTLDRVWPVDKTTRLPITDPVRIEAMDYEGKLRRASAKHNTKFVEYRPQTGSWVFKVEHFSKYGLSDSDEEDAVVDIKKQKLIQPTLQGTTAPQFPIKQVIPPTSMQIVDDDEDMDDGIRSPFDLDEKIESKALSPTSRLGKEIGTSSHKVQLMKASFFEHPDLNIDGEYLDYEDLLDQPTYKTSGFSFDSKQLAQALSWYNRGGYSHQLPADSFINIETRDDDDVSTASIREKEETTHMDEDIPDLIPKPSQPKMYVLKHWKDVLPYKRTTIGKINSKCLVDVGMLKGRSFSVKWGPCSQLTALSTACSTSCEDIFQGRLLDDTSSQVIQTLAIKCAKPTDDFEIDFQVSTEAHLICALKHSVCEISEDGCPYMTPKLRITGLHEHYSVAKQLTKGTNDPHLLFSANVWGLCQALWGALQLEDTPDSHLTMMQRKLAVSDWLKSVVADVVSNEMRKDELGNRDDPKNVFTLLTGYQVAEACEEAQNIGDHQMSLLLSQCRSGPGVRARAQKQLMQWRDTEADQFIDTTRIKLMMLVAGIPVHDASDRYINTCSDIDWLRTFALHLWYMVPYTSSLTDALIMYEKSFLSKDGDASCYGKPPYPPYLANTKNEDDEKPIYDVQYHLLKLFSVKSHPLEPLLNPASYTNDHLDYRLSWFLMRVLCSVGYSHVSDLAACIVHSSFASQLEAEGLWHWAVFVLLHIPDPVRRKNSALEMIRRHVSLDDKSEEEEFLLGKLKVPLAWVYEAKAGKAIFVERYDEAAKFLIKAELWNESHSVIINHISSKAIINEKYEYLEGLLSEISKNGRAEEISNWQTGGGVILEYLGVVREVERMVAAQDLTIGYHLERLQPQLTDLCLKIKLLKTEKPIDRLSQAEMAKRISGLVQNLIVAHWNNESEEGVNILAKLVKELPLPGDHSQWEWLRVMASWKISTTEALPTG